MLAFSRSFLNAVTSKILASILLVGLAAPAAAHTYFFGVSELNYNSKSKHIEIIHQFTAHDIENTIAEIKQIHFSAEHPSYDKYIQAYFEKHFMLEQNNKAIKLNWIGFEIRRGQIFAYQESNSANFLADLVVKNTILVDTYTKQINTVNYQGVSFAPHIKVQGSLTFNSSQRIAEIKALESQVNTSEEKQ
ncbi:MAG: hypothetical protein OQK09_14445 [Colwellia sp.]|nr:hypothetical protein [Colwellia sp.]MCW8865279.1 hypothetical protein [Colwellia sp.]MCW9082707.1 hypothetical protein [Colwellia sp.]